MAFPSQAFNSSSLSNEHARSALINAVNRITDDDLQRVLSHPPQSMARSLGSYQVLLHHYIHDSGLYHKLEVHIGPKHCITLQIPSSPAPDIAEVRRRLLDLASSWTADLHSVDDTLTANGPPNDSRVVVSEWVSRVGDSPTRFLPPSPHESPTSPYFAAPSSAVSSYPSTRHSPSRLRQSGSQSSFHLSEDLSPSARAEDRHARLQLLADPYYSGYGGRGTSSSNSHSRQSSAAGFPPQLQGPPPMPYSMPHHHQPHQGSPNVPYPILTSGLVSASHAGLSPASDSRRSHSHSQSHSHSPSQSRSSNEFYASVHSNVLSQGHPHSHSGIVYPGYNQGDQGDHHSTNTGGLSRLNEEQD